MAGLVDAVGGALTDKPRQAPRRSGGTATSLRAKPLSLGEATGDLVEPARALAGLARHLGSMAPELLDLARRALAPLLAEVHRAMRARGAETFSALLRDARDTLARHPAVRARLRDEITQLMVDEFQDTDRVQCEILRLLALDGPRAERPGLFLIGDPKQSIYGWRDADLAAYDGFLDLVREQGGEVMSLSVNFRSLPAILAEVERVVRPVMRHEPGVQPAFQPLLPCEERSAAADPTSGRRAPVEYWVSWTLAEEDPEASPNRPLRRPRSSRRARWLRTSWSCTGAGCAWREFGVLLRSTSDLDVYLQAFRDAGVPYLVERDRSYYRRREVIEAAALVRAVLDPGDHLALVTVLRSSVVGVPDAAFIPLWTRSFPDRVSEIAGAGGGRLSELRALVLRGGGRLCPRTFQGSSASGGGSTTSSRSSNTSRDCACRSRPSPRPSSWRRCAPSRSSRRARPLASSGGTASPTSTASSGRCWRRWRPTATRTRCCVRCEPRSARSGRPRRAAPSPRRKTRCA